MKALTYIDGKWLEGNPPIMGSMTHAAWLSSIVFDGARVFEGLAPDLDRHCERVVQSAHGMGLKPTLSGEEVTRLAWQGILQFDRQAELYVRPMFFAEEGFIIPDADSTRFVLAVYEAPLPKPGTGFSACVTQYSRPGPNMAPVDIKAACLYPNVARSMAEARRRGFDNSIVLDPLGAVAEFGNANLFMAKDGVLSTPSYNRTFLNGITRQRVMRLLKDDGVPVIERTIGYDELLDADEVFSTGNWAKVQAVTRIEDRTFQPGRFFTRARELYWAYAREYGRPKAEMAAARAG